MTISSETNRSGPYSCNGATTSFPYGFKIYDQTHIRVILTNASGVETALTLGTHYSVSGVGASGGGAVTTTTAYATGNKITLILNVPFKQNVDLENQGAYYAETIERAFDLLTQQALQLKEQIARAVVLPVVSEISVSELTNNIAVLAGMLSQLQTIAGISSQITTVAGIASDVVAAGTNAATATTKAAEAAASAVAAAASALAAQAWDPAAYLSKSGNLSGLASPATARTNLGLATVASSGAYADLSGKPTLGTAAALNVGSGANQIVQRDASGKLTGDGSLLTNIPLTVLQSMRVALATPTSLTAKIPNDNTIPQLTEGTQVLSLSFTPISATSKLRVRFQGTFSFVGGGRAIAALFLNGAADAVRAGATYNTNSACGLVGFDYEYSPGSVSSQTFAVRAGPDNPATSTTINSIDAVTPATLGGILASSLTVEEIA